MSSSYDPYASSSSVASLAHDTGVDVGEHAAHRAKFDLGTSDPLARAKPVPWGYGASRVTAMARDPDTMFVYWEITDEAIADALQRLGAGWDRANVCLRVYDTTDRSFDGTNSNHYFDVRVERHDREYFFAIHRPTSTVHVEVGMKSDEGYFQPMARSGATHFPRKSPSSNTHLEWLTVVSADDHPAHRPYQSRYGGPVAELRGPTDEAELGLPDVWHADAPPEDMVPPPLQGPTILRSFVVETSRMSVESFERYESMREFGEWPFRVSDWHAATAVPFRFFRGEMAPWFSFTLGTESALATISEGPFPVEVVEPGRTETLVAASPPYRVSGPHGAEFEVIGPFRVTLRSYGPVERRTLSVWTMHWVRTSNTLIERFITEVAGQREGTRVDLSVPHGGSQAMAYLGASEWWTLSGSERVWLGGSEGAARGASELWAMGASERDWMLGSARAWGASSEGLARGERVRADASSPIGSGSVRQEPAQGSQEQWAHAPFDFGKRGTS
jgi:hypothetical protein